MKLFVPVLTFALTSSIPCALIALGIYVILDAALV